MTHALPGFSIRIPPPKPPCPQCGDLDFDFRQFECVNCGWMKEKEE